MPRYGHVACIVLHAIPRLRKRELSLSLATIGKQLTRGRRCVLSSCMLSIALLAPGCGGGGGGVTTTNSASSSPAPVLASAPSITQLTPNLGPPSGGTQVRIAGAGF